MICHIRNMVIYMRIQCRLAGTGAIIRVPYAPVKQPWRIWWNELLEANKLPQPNRTQSNDVHIDGLVQGRRNSSAIALELRLPCMNPLIYYGIYHTCSFSFGLYWSVFRFERLFCICIDTVSHQVLPGLLTAGTQFGRLHWQQNLLFFFSSIRIF